MAAVTQRAPFLLLLMLTRLGEACVSKSVDVTVRSGDIEKHQVISKVNLGCCQTETLQIRTSDADFGVKPDGSLFATHALHFEPRRTFDIELQDSASSMQCTIHVRLLIQPHVQSIQWPARVRRAVILRRQKRRWRPLPFSINEAYKGPFPKLVQTIQSEYQQNYTMIYQLRGQGVDLPPTGVFSIESNSGRIFQKKAVDREEYPVLRLIGSTVTQEGYHLEDPLPLSVKVNDANDNAPQFTETEITASVAECSSVGTIFLKLNATDRDEPNTPHTSLRYRILSQQPASKFGLLFSVDEITGEIKTRNDKLDREEQDTYTLTVEVRDMGDAVNGLFSTATVLVRVTDANDNPPTFRTSQFTITVNETVSDIMILRLPVEDKDLANTEASRAVFTITKGNDRGNFKITTDPKTNDGLLYVVKPLNAEAESTIPLEIVAENEIPLIGSSASRKTASVVIKVQDVDEGPEFEPRVKQLWIKENVPTGTVLGSYTARDPETKSSSGISYRKLLDPADWVSIDPKTGKIKTTAVLDRESDFVKNNKYNVTVLAIEDRVPARTGTGTVIINLNDDNDNVPIIGNDHLYICENGIRQFVNVSAEDLDVPPNSAPFTFLLPESPPEIRKKWSISEKMASYAYIRPVDRLPPGYYEVPVMVQDQQHQGKLQTVKIMICNCPNNENCAGKLASKSAVLGGMGILVMLLAALLLLCLLLAAFAFYCGSDQRKKPPLYPDTQYHQSLIVTNDEGGGQQDKNLGALDIPLSRKDNFTSLSDQHSNNQETNFGQGQFHTFGHTSGATGASSGAIVTNNENINTGRIYTETNVQTQHYQTNVANTNLTTFESSTLSRRNSHNLMDVLRSRVDQVYEDEELREEVLPVDYIHDYRLEGAESADGSVGCYSDARESVEYLNNLEPRFGPLASMSLNR
ncbi:desmocollin-3-like [Mustelus asterias]